MIMWYGFGRDIGSAGPTVAQFVPWIVPERLREMPGGYSRGEATSTRPYPRRFPSINNNQRPIDASPETRFQKPAQEDGKTPSMPSAPDILDEPPHESGPSIAETIAKLRQLQKDWSATPREQQAEMVRQYCVEIKQLSKVSAELKGPSSVVWRKEIASLSREILSHSKMPTVIQMGATGSWKGVAPTLPNDFVATVINVRNENEPNSNAAWMLQEKWRYGTVDVAIEILPGAWPAGSRPAASLPISENCLLFGRLLLKSDSVDAANDLVADYLVLRVHAVFLPHASPSNR